MNKYSIEAGCTCLDSAYERKAIDEGMNHNPVFPENIQYMKDNLHERFNKWLYENYSIWNGDRLISLLEDGDVQAKFLSDMGLPDDTEL